MYDYDSYGNQPTTFLSGSDLWMKSHLEKKSTESPKKECEKLISDGLTLKGEKMDLSTLHIFYVQNIYIYIYIHIYIYMCIYKCVRKLL